MSHISHPQVLQRSVKRCAYLRTCLRLGFSLLVFMLVSAGTRAARADDAKQLFFEGFELLKAGKAKAAAAKFEQGLKQEPNNAEAHFYLGEAYRARKQVSKARQQYEASLKVDENSEVAVQARERLAAFTDEAAQPKKNSRTVKDPIIKDGQGNITGITGWHVLRFGMTADEVSQALGLPVNLEKYPPAWMKEEQILWRVRYEGYDVGGIKAELDLKFVLETQVLESIELTFPYNKHLEEQLLSELKSRYGSNPKLDNYSKITEDVLRKSCSVLEIKGLQWPFSNTWVKWESSNSNGCDENFQNAYHSSLKIIYGTKGDPTLGKTKPKL